MTDKEKASKLLDRLEEFDSRTVINALSCKISDEDLAEIYDTLVEDGLI